MSRVKALLRRKGIITKEEVSNSIIKVQDIVIDRERYIVTLDEESLNLPRKEFEILYLLASKP